MTRTVRIGDTIAGKYRVERMLGTGGMGVVVAARHLDMGWLRAVKIMHPEPAGKQGWIHRFRREAQVGSRLQSDHAVRVFDVGGFDDGQPYIVMEHLEGTDLGKLLRARGRLPIEDAVRYVAQACDAVAEAHRLGVIHRDLKPANLFVITGIDGAPCLKVLDFGISKSGLSEDDEALRLTQTGEVIGSPAYMAPEQIRSFHSADPRSDVWALGVILYELITGRWPFPGKASVEMIAMILERAADPPSRHRPEVPPALEAVLLRCLEKDPAKRLPSALALREALLPFLPAPAPLPFEDTPVAEDAPTLVAAPRPSLLPPMPVAAAPIVQAPEASAEVIEAAPTSVQTTSPPLSGLPLSGVQHTLPLAGRRSEGPSTRVVLLVAAGAIATVVVGLTVLMHSAGPAAQAASEHAATSAAAEGSALPASEPAPVVTAATPVETAAPAPEVTATAATVETAMPAAPDPVSASPAEPGARPAGKIGAAPSRNAEPRAGGGGRQIDQVAALAALGNAAIAAKRCKKPGGPTGSSRVEVTFAPSGGVSSVRLGGPFDGTPVGKCITGVFKSIRVPPFEGSSFSAGKTVTIK
ncbi:MAG: protein kinase [Minicystis sp.]